MSILNRPDTLVELTDTGVRAKLERMRFEGYIPAEELDIGTSAGQDRYNAKVEALNRARVDFRPVVIGARTVVICVKDPSFRRPLPGRDVEDYDAVDLGDVRNKVGRVLR